MRVLVAEIERYGLRSSDLSEPTRGRAHRRTPLEDGACCSRGDCPLSPRLGSGRSGWERHGGTGARLARHVRLWLTAARSKSADVHFAARAGDPALAPDGGTGHGLVDAFAAYKQVYGRERIRGGFRAIDPRCASDFTLPTQGLQVGTGPDQCVLPERSATLSVAACVAKVRNSLGYTLRSNVGSRRVWSRSTLE